jgi:cysteine desulfurase
MRSIYLDHNATAPLAPEVFEAMAPHWLAPGNPDSRHSPGRAARRAWETAKETVARILGADPSEVVFTSGGTEANNLALFGLARRDRGARHIVASPIEHPAVAEPLGRLEGEGLVVDRPDIGPEGVMDADALSAALRSDTRLGTLILANNETGAIQPVTRFAESAAALGIPTHTDAVQAVGRIPVNFRALGVTTLAASAHKFHGPVGIGVLLIQKGITFPPYLLGGSQQGGRRPGTMGVALAVGLATALARWQTESEARITRWRLLRDRLEQGLINALGRESVVRNGPADESQRLPQTLNVGFPCIDGDALMIQLDLAGIAASQGSACASGAIAPSPTLLAMGVPADHLRSSVRFSLGALSTEAEIDEALERIVNVLQPIMPKASEKIF